MRSIIIKLPSDRLFAYLSNIIDLSRLISAKHMSLSCKVLAGNFSNELIFNNSSLKYTLTLFSIDVVPAIS